MFEGTVATAPDISVSIPCSLKKFSLIRVWKFPVPLRREFGCKLLNVRVDQTPKIAVEGPDSAKFPVNFPVSREFGEETGSQLTASSASQSVSNAY